MGFLSLEMSAGPIVTTEPGRSPRRFAAAISLRHIASRWVAVQRVWCCATPRRSSADRHLMRLPIAARPPAYEGHGLGVSGGLRWWMTLDR
jgi:hypothetical protein